MEERGPTVSSVVIDASLFGPLLIPDETPELHADLMPIMLEGRALVPQHWRLEIANIGVIALRRQRVSRDNMLAGMASIDGFKIETDDQTTNHSLGRTLELALKHGLTSYDAAYLELAQRRDVPIFTRDQRLADAAIADDVRAFGR